MFALARLTFYENLLIGTEKVSFVRIITGVRIKRFFPQGQSKLSVDEVSVKRGSTLHFDVKIKFFFFLNMKFIDVH